MQDKHSLLFRMKDPELPVQDQEQHSLPLQDPLLRDTMLNPQTPSLLMQMSSPQKLQGLPMSQTQKSTTVYSSDATPSSNNIARGRSPNRQFTSRSNRNLQKRLEVIEQDQTLLLDRSLRLSKAMIQKLEQRQVKEERSSRCSAPPALLYRFQMDTSQMRNLSPKRLKSTNQPMHGYQEDEINEPYYETHSPRLSSSSKFIPSIPKQPNSGKRSLVNEPDCPEFPDSEWKNIIAGRAVNLDAVLSGQLSTTHDDPKVEKFGELEITFGVVEPTKLVKNGGDWTIAWNRTVRATVYAFPHRLPELTSYGEYIVNLFSVPHPSVHSRVIAFDKAVRKRIGSVRNLELWDFDKFADLKIAHMDSIGVSVVAGSSRDDSGRKAKKGKNWKKDEPCNKWNDGKCNQEA